VKTLITDRGSPVFNTLKNVASFFNGTVRFFDSNGRKQVLSELPSASVDLAAQPPEYLHDVPAIQNAVFKYGNCYIHNFSPTVSQIRARGLSGDIAGKLSQVITDMYVYYKYTREYSDYLSFNLNNYTVVPSLKSQEEVEKDGYTLITYPAGEYTYLYELLEDIPLYFTDTTTYEVRRHSSAAEVVSKFSRNIIAEYYHKIYGDYGSGVSDASRLIEYLFSLNYDKLPLSIQTEVDNLTVSEEKAGALLRRLVDVNTYKQQVFSEVTNVLSASEDYNKFV